MNVSLVWPMLLYLAAVFVIGYFSSKHMGKAPRFLQEYFLGGRELGGFMLAMTLTATYGSASSFLGGPGTAYTLGLGWVLLAMSQLVTGYFTLAVLGKKFAIMSRKIGAVTLVDFLQARYRSKGVVLWSSFAILLFLFSAMAAQWVGGGRLIQSFTGIPYEAALFIFAVTVLGYVAVGGFRAVAITDAIQGVIMVAGTVVLLIATVVVGGGVEPIMEKLAAENPRLITPFGADGSLTPLYVSSFWILVGVGVVGLPQVAVRAMSYKDSRAMHRAMVIGTFVIGAIMLGMHLIGVFARAVVPGVEVGDTVMPVLALKVLPAWLAGIFLAAPMAAIMSTVDSLLLLISSTLIKDVYLNYIRPEADARTVKILSVTVTAVIGVLVFLTAIKPPELLIWLNLYAFGGLEAAFIWPIVLGLYWKKGNDCGAMISIIVGMASYLVFGRIWENPLGMHGVVLPVILSLLGYVIGSWLTSHRDRERQREIIVRFWGVR
ncbi:sodium/pantothenate symporter [Paludifilum halophilum]|uniref:Sodium/panthothenate symporter n=1 Tax=Paludifilum halophilum TaxID=1642702 RepID=A0A235B304_9BACL|nr:sodium/pantothenate symporter [Paludifilum halophilum]OYD06653.1 sodium/panthothenate symporter [Paludifilum halophilum]